MRDFQSFLKKSTRVTEKQLSFFSFWISSYHAFGKNHAVKNIRSVNAFLLELSQKYEAWQVTQAAEALQLYSCYKEKKNPHKIAPFTEGTGVQYSE